MQYQARRVPNNSRLLGTVFDTAKFPIAIQMRNSYQDCLEQLLQDEGMKFHLVMRPLEPGDHYILQAGDDSELEESIERSIGIKVEENDVIIVLCCGFLTSEKSPNEMMKIAICDLTNFIHEHYTLAEPAAGSVGSILSWVTVSSILSNLVSIKDSELISSTIQDLKNEGVSMLGGERIAKIGLAKHKSHFEILNALCNEIESSNGCHLSLPISMMDVIDSGRTVLSRVLDERVT